MASESVISGNEIAPSQESESPVIKSHARCIDCDYDLFGLATDGECPECSASIATSVEAHEGLNPAWLESLYSGLVLFVGAHWVALVMSFSIATALIGAAFLGVMLFIASWSFGSRSSYDARTQWMGRSAAGSILFFPIWLAVGSVTFTWIQTVILIWPIPMWYALFITWRLLGRTMSRLEEVNLARQCKVVSVMVTMWFIVVAGFPIGWYRAVEVVRVGGWFVVMGWSIITLHRLLGSIRRVQGRQRRLSLSH